MQAQQPVRPGTNIVPTQGMPSPRLHQHPRPPVTKGVVVQALELGSNSRGQDDPEGGRFGDRQAVGGEGLLEDGRASPI